MDNNEQTKTDYDSAWKDVIEGLFEPFTKFFFPKIHKEIEFSRGIEVLDSDLRDIAPYGNVGKRYADELIKVWLKDGTPACIYLFIHIEVQGYKEAKGVFPERAFVYYYRIYDKNIDKEAEIISIAIMTDEDENYRPNEHLKRRLGFELRMKIPMVKIIDYKNKPKLKKKLETSKNPMAMIVKAQLRSFELKKAGNKQKSSVKWELIRECYEKRYPKEEIRVLIKFLDWLILLPDGLAKKLSIKIKKLEEDYKMPYVTSFERIGIEKGEKNKAIEMAKRMKQDGEPIDKIAKYSGLTVEEIEKLAEEEKAAKKTH